MRIISRFKDYYDFQQGIYGIDPILILNRTNFNHQIILGNFSIIKIYICGTEFQGVFYKGEFYWKEKILNLIEILPLYRYWLSKELKEKNYIISDPDPKFIKNNLSTKHYEIPKKSKDHFSINDDLNCAIIIENIDGKLIWNKNKYSIFPILSNYNFIDALPPKEIWIMLSEWLSKDKKIENKQTDKEKIISNGFDMKTSFRGK